MATGGVLEIDANFLKQLKDADKALNKISETSQKMTGHVVKWMQDVNKDGVMPFYNHLQQLEQKYRSTASTFENVRGYKRFSQQAKKAADSVQKLMQEIAKSPAYQAKVESLTRAFKYEQIKKYGDNSKQAFAAFNRLYSDKGVQSLNNMNKVLHQLTDAQNKLNLRTDEGKRKYDELGKKIQKIQGDINKATGAQDRFGRSQSRLLNTTDQLQRKLALLFSVSAITGYMNKLVAIRKEFELQHKSLGILLMDADKADKIWNQTIALAVKSPFRVKELVTYTKQLAAYRIETDLLHDTTKRLADVSAGLGVDMSRLILAYGQVRAASFLRGTELRQFTEAGIPMLDELAEHFEKVKGKAVSVSDVFEMISKRKVSFEDVAAVFKKMTDEGGVFYRMQEEQSKTLHGMISNLHDSIDLMLNDIGQSNDGIMKGGVEVAKSLVDNWRAFAAVLKMVGSSMLMLQFFQFVSGWHAVAQSGAAAAAAMNGAAGAAARLRLSLKVLANTIKANPLLMFIGLLSSAVWAIYEYNDAVNAKNKVYDEESARNIRKIDELEKIQKQVEQNNKTLLDNKKILEDSASSEEDSTRATEENTVVTKENQTILAKLKKEFPGVFLAISQQEDGTLNLNKAIAEQNKILEQNIALQQRAKGGWFTDDMATNYKELVESQAKVTGGLYDLKSAAIDSQILLKNSKGALTEQQYKAVEKHLKQLKQVTSYEDALGKISFDYSAVDAHGIQYQKIHDILYGTLSVWEDLNKNQKTFSKDSNNLWDNVKKEMPIIKASLSEITGDWSYQLRGKRVDEILDQFGITDEKIRKQLKDNIKTELSKDKIYIDYGWQWLFKDDSNKEFAEWQKKYNEFVQSLNNTNVESITDSKTTRDALRKSLKEQAEEAKAIIDSYQVEGQIVYTQEEFEEAKQLYSDLGKAYVAAGGNIADFDKKNKKNKEEAIKILNNRIALVKELNKQYEELREHYGEEEAQARVMESYADTFKEAFEGTGINFKGLVVDENKLQEIKNQGEVSGQVFSEEMMKKIEEVTSSGTYIRGLGNLFDATKEQLKKHEGFRGVMYSDSTGKPITSRADLEKFFTKSGGRKKGSGTLTIGYGHAIQNLKEAEKYLGVTLSQVEAESLLVEDMREREGLLNNLLDKHNQLLVTQEQYGVLFNNYYQGGLSAALKRADQDISETQTYIDKLDQDLQKMGTSFANEFGANWLEEYEKLETYAEKVAKQLEISALTTVDKNGHIDPALYKGMKSRSAERAASFRGDLDVVNMLYRASVDVSQIDFTNIEGVVSTLKQLAPIAAKEGKEAQLALSKAISEFEVQIGIKAEVIQDKALTDLVEGMFADYEMSLELEKLGFPKDIASEVFGLDSLSLQEVRKMLENMRPQFDSKKQIEEWNNYIKKVDELEEKAQLERLKKYSQYLIKGMSERVKIKTEELRQIREFESESKFTKEQKSDILSGIQKETQKKLDKQDWEDFKGSDMYTQLFGDVEHLGIQTIRKLKENLENLKSSLKDLDASEVKEIMTQINKLEELEIKHNPFQAIRDSLKEVSALKKEGRTEDFLQSELSSSQDKISESQSLIDAIGLINNAKREGLSLDSQSAEWQKQYGHLLNLSEESLSTILSINKDIVRNETNKSNRASNDLDIYAKARSATEALQSELSSVLNLTQKAYGSIKDILVSMGVDSDSTAMVFADMGMSLVDIVAQAIMFQLQLTLLTAQAEVLGVAINTALGPIGWVVMALQAVATLMSTILGQGDKKKEKQIQSLTERVKDLERAFEDLEEATKSAYNIDNINIGYETMRDNIEEQIAATEKMIKLEEDKKDTDHGKIADWKRELEDYNKKLKELEDERINQLGGIAGGDAIHSTSQSFVDAWFEAFRETGDGLSGLEEQFDEVYMNLVKKQVLGRGVDKMLKPLYSKLNGMLEDGAMTAQEFEDFTSTWDGLSPQISEFLTNVANDLGIADDVTRKNGELSGLQEGISGITEDQADILAAYWSSVRFIVSSIEQKFTEYARQMLGTDLSANPILNELKAQTSLLDEINDKLGSVIGHSGGAHIKTNLIS